MNKTSRTLAQVFSGILSAQAGVMAGEQQAHARDLQEQELQRRRQEDEQNQLLRLFTMGAETERRQRAETLDPFDEAIRLSDRDANLSPLVSAREAARTGLGPSQYGVEQFRMMTGSTGPAGRYTGPSQPLPSSAAPRPVAAAPQPIRTDPRIEAARKAAFMDLDDAYRESSAVDPVLAGKFSSLRTRLAAKQITPEQALTEAEPLRAGLTTRFQQQQKTREEGEAFDREERVAARGDRAELRAIRKRDQDLAEENRLRDDAGRVAKEIETRLSDAVEAGDIAEIMRFGKARAQHGKKNAQYLPTATDDPFDPDQRMVTRIGPIGQKVRLGGPKGLTAQFVEGVSPEGELVEGPIEVQETPAERDARILRAAEARAQNPESKRKLLEAQIPRLLSIMQNPAVTEEGRLDAGRRLGQITGQTPGLANVFPSALKLEKMTPALQEQHEMNLFNQGLRLAKEERDIQADRKALVYKTKQIEKLDREARGSSAGPAGGATPAKVQGEAFSLLSSAAKEALAEIKSLKAVPKDKQARIPTYQQDLAEAQSKYDEAASAYQAAIASGDALTPVRERHAKKAALDTIARAQARSDALRAKQGLQPQALTQQQINALSRASRGN